MHKISKILNKNYLSLEDIKEITNCWNEMLQKSLRLRTKKAPLLYKGCKKHLTLSQISSIEISSKKCEEKFPAALNKIKACLIYTKKQELRKLVERKANGNNSQKLEEAIILLLTELKEEKKFLKELLTEIKDVGIIKLASKAIPQQFSEILMQ